MFKIKNFKKLYSTSTKVADVFYKCLKKNNVTDVFAYSGGSVMPLIDSLYKSKINYYINSHEQNCGHSATGYAKTSNKTGVVLVTSGPGITNMITPMLDATNDSTPLVVFSGQVPLKAIGTDAFQEAPAIELSKNVTKWSYQIKEPSEFIRIVNLAFHIANNGKKGAVHIDIPKCISVSDIKISSSAVLNNYYDDTYYFNRYNYINIIDLINNAKKPIIYLGQGCVNYHKILREFAIKTNIPVTSTIHACGIFDESHPLSLRWCGMHGNYVANKCLQEADCIIALGSRFDDRTTGDIKQYAPNALKAQKEGTGGIIHVNISDKEIRKVVKSEYNFEIDCGAFLNKIINQVKFNERKEWFEYIKENNTEENQFRIINNGKLNMENVLDTIYKKTVDYEDNIIFTTGVGNHQMQAYQFIKSHYPKKIISSGSLGVMGAGLPYAIGAQIANPNKTVVLIDGDSSFNMTMSDMKTIVEYNLPIKIMILNNNAQMMVTIWEKLFFNERYTATLNRNNPSYTKVAEGFGIKSLYCDKLTDLDKTIDLFLSEQGSVLCEFKIEKGMCLPLVAPGKALNDMITYDNLKNMKIDGMMPS